MSKLSKLLTVELVRLITTSITLMIFLSIIVNSAWNYLLPDSGLVRKLDAVNLHFLLLITFLLVNLGWAVSYLAKITKLISPLSLSKGELFTNFVTALFFAVFFSQTNSLLSSYRPYSIIISTLILLFLLPQWVNFFATFNLSKWSLILTEIEALWQQERENLAKIKSYRLRPATIVKPRPRSAGQLHFWPKPRTIPLIMTSAWASLSSSLNRLSFLTIRALKTIIFHPSSINLHSAKLRFRQLSFLTIKTLNSALFAFINKARGSAKITLYYLTLIIAKLFVLITKVVVIFIVFLALSILALLLIVNHLDYLEYQKTIQGMFFISQIQPQKTIYGEKVELTGYNFGAKTEGFHYRIMSSYGEIGIHEWTQNKVGFVVPLHLKETSMYLWLERVEANQENSAIIKSNEVIFTVVPRSGFYPDSLSDPIWKRGLRKLKRIIYVEKGLLYRLP